MKLLKFMLLIAFTTLLIVDGNAQQKQKTSNASKKQKTNSESTKMDKPQYEITVFQSGKELGKIVLETFPTEAPLHAANFDSLVTTGFYNGTAFHRVISGFMIQGGDPNTKNHPDNPNMWGMGDPSQKRVPAEFNAGKPNWSHKRGILSAARSSDPNSATSQFFIMHGDSPSLDGQYSIYGQVLKGQEVVDKIATTPTGANDRPNEKITMQIKKLTKSKDKSKK